MKTRTAQEAEQYCKAHPAQAFFWFLGLNIMIFEVAMILVEGAVWIGRAMTR